MSFVMCAKQHKSGLNYHETKFLAEYVVARIVSAQCTINIYCESCKTEYLGNVDH